MSEHELLLLQALIGQVLPPVTDVLNKYIPTSKVRFLASLLLSAVIAIVFNYKSLQFGNLDQFLMSALVLWVSGQSAYKLYYGGSQWQNNIRFTTNPLPLKELVPPVNFSSVLPK